MNISGDGQSRDADQAVFGGRAGRQIGEGGQASGQAEARAGVDRQVSRSIK